MNERTRPQPPLAVRAVLPLALLFLYLPLLVMVLGSFVATPAEGRGFTLEWYRQLVVDPVLWEALARSFEVALGSAMLATALALVAALALERWVFAGRWPLRFLSTVSLMLPELVLALSLLSWFASFQFELSLLTVIIAHVTLTLPFAILVIAARLQALDSSIEEAARDLGASELQVLRKVTLPLLMPGLGAAFVLAFLLSFDDFLVTFYTNGAGGDTLPVKLYSLMKTGLSPKVQALSSVMLFVSVALVALLVRFRPRMEA
ncbi:MAG: ABC transporter permease [Bdellovibrionota bacterium]